MKPPPKELKGWTIEELQLAVVQAERAKEEPARAIAARLAISDEQAAALIEKYCEAAA